MASGNVNRPDAFFKIMKSIDWQGWNISLEGDHMKNKKAFVAEMKSMWNDDRVAVALWEHLQKEKLNDGNATNTKV